MPPRENSLGVPGQAASNAQNLQNVRQQGANYRGQQIYNDPTTHAGREAQAAWLKNNPIPQQSIDTVYGGVNYGNKLQKDTEVAVDQEQIGRGGPGTGNAMIRAGMLDANGYKPGTPGVNSRDTRSEADQYAHQNRVMADIKREGAEARARGEQFQPKGVNIVNPSRRADISGDRRRLELANGEPKFSRDEGGVNYAGPKKQPAPLAAPTPAPVAQTTPAPAAQEAQPKRDPYLEFLRQKGVIRPDGSFDNAAEANLSPEDRAQLKSFGTVQNQGGGVQKQGGAQSGGMSPEQHAALAEYQAKDNARRRSEGSTKPDNDYTKLSPIEQKATYDFLLERGAIPRPVRPPTGQVPNPRNPNKDMNDRPMIPKAPSTTQVPAPDRQDQKGNLGVKETNPVAGVEGDFGLPAPEVTFTPDPGPKPIFKDPGKPQGLEPLVRGEQGSLENILKPKPQGVPIPPPPGTKNPSLAPEPQRTPPRPIAPPSSGLKGSTTPRAPAPKPKEPFTIGDFTQAVDENSTPVGPRPPRITTPNFKEGMTFKSPVMQQFNTPKPVEGVDKMPTIKKSNPITDTIKASNNPVPVAQPNPKQNIQPVRNVIKRIRGR